MYTVPPRTTNRRKRWIVHTVCSGNICGSNTWKCCYAVYNRRPGVLFTRGIRNGNAVPRGSDERWQRKRMFRVSSGVLSPRNNMYPVPQRPYERWKGGFVYAVPRGNDFGDGCRNIRVPGWNGLHANVYWKWKHMHHVPNRTICNKSRVSKLSIRAVFERINVSKLCTRSNDRRKRRTMYSVSAKHNNDYRRSMRLLPPRADPRRNGVSKMSSRSNFGWCRRFMWLSEKLGYSPKSNLCSK